MAANYGVFISYSRQDELVAKRIFDALNSNGVPAYRDLDGLEAGSVWAPALTQALDGSEAVAILLSEASVNSPAVLKEVEYAIAKNKALIPVIIRGKAGDLDGPVVELLHDRHWMSLVNRRGAISSLDPLIRAAKRHWGRIAPVIAFSNLKGGVGKTTLAAQISSALAAKGRYSILMIDLDPQANLTQFVLTHERHAELVGEDQSVLSLFEKSLVYGAPSPRTTLTNFNGGAIEHPEISRVACEVGNSSLGDYAQVSDDSGSVFIVPGQFELVKYTLPQAANYLPQLEANFAKSLHEARKVFDAVIIDLNPSSSFMIKCALTHATHIVCPIRPDMYSVQGLTGLKKLIDSAFALSNPPKIISLLNAVPSWDDDFVSKIRSALKNPSLAKQLVADKKTGQAAKVIGRFLRNPSDTHVLENWIPETTMLKAYFAEPKSGGFFTISRHSSSGPYGQRLASRLSGIATEIAEFTKLDPLDGQDSGRHSKKA
ncbi:AAA family ATPase [Hyphomonas sp.]|uniref:AAA family ATPase n=1 Tax=Hyphomonas sp. TaxID=87 RepID=UPI003D287ACF